jgi:hypothetical protein
LVIMNDGNYNGLQVVSRSWVMESTRKHITGEGVGYGIGEFAIHAVIKENGLVDHARFSVGLRSYRLDKEPFNGSFLKAHPTRN